MNNCGISDIIINYLRNAVNCWIKLLITIHMCYLGYNYLRNVVNCWIKLLITIQMWYNYLRNKVNCWIKLLITIQMWYISRSFLVEYYQFPSSTKNNYSNSWHGTLFYTTRACNDVNSLIHILCSWSELSLLDSHSAVIWSGNNCSVERFVIIISEIPQLFARGVGLSGYCHIVKWKGR